MKKVLLLLCNGVEIYEAAAFYDVLGWARAYGTEPIECVTTGLQTPLRSTFGMQLTPDCLLSEVDPLAFEALAIPGGFETYGYYDEAYSEPVGHLIRQFADAKRTIASICVGALPVAKSGILNGRRATTYHLRKGLARQRLAAFGADVVDAPVVTDGNVITSTAPVTAMEVAFQLLARLTSDENSQRIRHLMGFAA